MQRQSVEKTVSDKLYLYWCDSKLFCDSKAFVSKQCHFFLQFIKNEMEKYPIRLKNMHERIKKSIVHTIYSVEMEKYSAFEWRRPILKFLFNLSIIIIIIIVIMFARVCVCVGLCCDELKTWKGSAIPQIGEHDLKHTYRIVCYSILYYDFLGQYKIYQLTYRTQAHKH